MDTTVAALRAFNRFHTRFTGVLEPRFLGSDLGVTEARVLYEMAQADGVAAVALGQALALDPGYLSRMLKRFAARGWIAPAPAGGRRRPLALTAAGRDKFAAIDAAQRARVEARVAPLSPAERDHLTAALGTARALLGGGGRDWMLRPFATGDLGVIASRQSILYKESNGWGAGMERLVLQVCGDFLRDHVPGRSGCWVADRDGAVAGSVFVVDAGDGVAQLRLLYVEPSARGLGIGRALVDRCVDFARHAGYRELMLWTHSVLTPARALYASTGFVHRSTDLHHEFGEPVDGETWALPLG